MPLCHSSSGVQTKGIKPSTSRNPLLDQEAHHPRATAQTRSTAVNFGSIEQGISVLENASANRDLTVCLVDDDPSVLKATARLLSSAGWKTESFTDPAEFLRHAEACRPPLVVLDILMPVMSGLEVQSRLRSISPATRVVVLTSKDDPLVRSKAIEAGASAFFLKPPPDGEFLGEIESICREFIGRA
jgi:PleD family two-component response regulator